MLHVIKQSSPLKNLIDRCDSAVEKSLQTSDIREADIALESFRNGGKRLRPVLMLLSATVARGGSIQEVEQPMVDLACAIELIHLATLFHDDVIDDVEKRRGKPSARNKYGNYISVLAGDFALAEALLFVQRSRLVYTMPEFLRTIAVLVRGESKETQHKYDFTMTDATYYEIISEKSASLFALSCKVGALSIRSEFSDMLGHFGWNLGMAFQMIDDLDDMLDVSDNSFDCDLKNGYLSLPVVQALSSLKDGHRETLIDIIKRGEFTPDDEKAIVSTCCRLGTIRNTRSEIGEYLGNARGIIEKFDSSEARSLLEMILDELAAYSDAQVSSFESFSSS
jgi:octaprenyl-diphosphate synthase